jgi:uroporphyrinogen decarboxylase
VAQHDRPLRHVASLPTPTSRGLLVNLHSDGYIMQIMDDLIEIGYDSMHPVQESSPAWTRAPMKDRYGDKITIYGSLDVIDGLLAYDGDALEEYITRRFEIYAPGGGFIYNTGHFVQPDIPPQRLLHAYRVIQRLAAQHHTP